MTVPVSPTNGASALDAPNYRFLQDYVYRESGIVLGEDKRYLMEARLLPIVQKEGLQSLNDLCALLRAVNSTSLRQQVIDSMTTNETQFFREIAQYEALRKIIIPSIIEQKRGLRRLSVWSAASSTGQEIYSLAMMLLEMGMGDWNLSLLGTDLCTRVLQKARDGRYLQIEVNRGLPAALLVKYFTRSGLDWQLKDQVRNMAKFIQFDLRQSMRTLGPFDIVFCRNVLIYFDTATKKQILGEIRSSLFGGGYLLLGGSETTLNLDSQYERVTAGQTVVYRNP